MITCILDSRLTLELTKEEILHKLSESASIVH